MKILPRALRLCMMLLVLCSASSHAQDGAAPAPQKGKPPCVGMGCGQKEPECVGLGCGEKDLCIGMGCDQSQQNHVAETAQVTLKLHNKVTAGPEGRSTIQRDVVRLTASVANPPPDSRPPVYQFALWGTQGNSPVMTSGEFSPNPQWIWDPDTLLPNGGFVANGVLLRFVVTVKLGSLDKAVDTSTEIGPYLLQCDECARRVFSMALTPIMTHPRCVNCHNGRDGPAQGDDRHPHVPAVDRLAVCSQCHLDQNGTTPGSPPGAPGWRLPPKEFVFKDKRASELCRQLKDPARTGGRNLEQVYDHLLNDPRIKWPWNPGLERTSPPEDWNTFVKQFDGWVRAGAACPDDDASSQPVKPGLLR